MSLRVVGAGLGRTGTLSLKVALEKLLGGPCYHMLEVFTHPEHVPVWGAAARGERVDWEALFAGYRAGVDWPQGSFWEEIAEAFPDAIILLSLRDTDAWWQSASQTIFKGMAAAKSRAPEWHAVMEEIFTRRFVWPPDDEAAAKAAYERHNADVLARAPKDRLLVWQASDGWGPLCERLGVKVPAEPFPRVNTREEFLARLAAAQ
jgi:hypothetical protein